MGDSEEKLEKDNREFLEILLDDVCHKIMGKSLDIMRISGMSDRSLVQATRTIKDYTNELIKFSVQTLKEKDYIKEDSK